MKKFPQLKTLLILSAVFAIFLLSLNTNDVDQHLLDSLQSVSESLVLQNNPPPPSSVPTLVTVCCGEARVEEAMVLFKSAIALSTSPLHLVAVTNHKDRMEIILKDLIKASTTSHNISFLVVPPSLPAALLNAPITGPCSTARFFLGSMVPSIDRVIYMDSDTILLQPLQVLWSRFSNMSSGQIIGAAEDNPLYPPFSYVNTSGILPFPPPTGLNSGVLLLNLHLLRSSTFEEVYVLLWKLAYDFLVFEDQDILNMIARFRPDLVFTLEPMFNFTPLYCWIFSNILSTEEKQALGKAHVIHGVGAEFHPPGLAKTFNIFVMHLKKFYRNKLYYFHLYKMLGTFKSLRLSTFWDLTEHIGCKHRQIYQYVKTSPMEIIEPQMLNNNSNLNVLCNKSGENI